MPYSLENDTLETVGPLSTPCRVWRWATSSNGRGLRYGSVCTTGKNTTQAHRRFYELYRSQIPEDLELDHLCRNTLCVNPDHLEPVTRAENVWRGAQTKLSRNEVRVLRLYAESCRVRDKPRPEKSLVAAFGLHRTTLNAIIIGKRWRGLDK